MSATACWTLERSPAAESVRATADRGDEAAHKVPIGAIGAGLVLHDLLFKHGGDHSASAPQSAAIFGGTLKNAFELIHTHLQKRQQQAAGCVLFLTAYTHEELQNCIRDESTEWQSFARAFRDEAAVDPGQGLLSFMDQVQLRHLPTPKHLFALLALTEVSLPITQELPALLKSRLVLTSDSPEKSNSTTPQAKLSKGSKQTCLPSAPSLVILHGLSRWFRAGAPVEQLVSAISHSLMFCNDIVPASRQAAGANDDEEDDDCAASLLWFDDPAKSGEAQAQDMKSVLEAVAKRYFDTIVRYEAAHDVDTPMQ